MPEFSKLPPEQLEAMIKEGERVTEIVQSRWPKSGDLSETEINNLIANYTLLADSPLSELNGESQHYRDLVGVYAYLRDVHGATTMGEALDVIKNAEVPINVVELWIEEGFCSGPQERWAVVNGYPELKEMFDKK